MRYVANFCRTPLKMSDLPNIAQVALIILKNIRPSLISHRDNPKKIELVLEPVFGFHWAKKLSISVGAGGGDDFFHCVKGTSLSKEKIDKVGHWFNETFYAEVVPIPLGVPADSDNLV